MTELYGLNDSYFTFYLKDGRRLVQKERSFSDAMRALNVDATDIYRYDKGITDTHKWCENNKIWDRKLPGCHLFS